MLKKTLSKEKFRELNLTKSLRDLQYKAQKKESWTKKIEEKYNKLDEAF